MNRSLLRRAIDRMELSVIERRCPGCSRKILFSRGREAAINCPSCGTLSRYNPTPDDLLFAEPEADYVRTEE